MSSSTGCDTLRILRLPPYLNDAKRDELFKKYGATNTKTIRKSDNYTETFVKFASKAEATRAFLHLHQLEIKGQYLSVEFARKSMDELIDNGLSTSKSINDNEETVDSTHFQAFINKLNTWASGYDFSQPPPPNIMYKYPLPTKTTLLRIAIQLLKEPAFYTQVLHLMNKMNLPPPFEELEAEFPSLKEAYDVDNYQDIFGRVISDTEEIKDDKLPEGEDEEEESELESDEESNVKPVEVIPVKRKLRQSTKRLKIPKFVNPTKHPISVNSTQKVIRPEDMFESVQREEIKNMKIELKSVGKLMNQESIDVNRSNKDLQEPEGGFGLMFPAKKDDEESKTEVEEEKPKEFISSEELAANRVSANDQRVLPVFKNYHPGKPSCRLYIKNLAKQVELKDLHYIYRRYVISSLENSESQYDVRLMQEGRMKGQAFVTFQNTGQAQLALNETNGFILKDKPMVVQFAKVTKSS
ncbi:RNA-binding region-containing protein 3 [Chelonus insularis]|uniref:RNA-binding region-containing protein 3 n=1 Tax=Chelonus insularis TaxID=460826 RepID=UPI0015883994|nr:RNA-binding region-containing protein 3 [Chelonus insularis]